MNVTTKSNTGKFSVVVLGAAAIYCLFTVLLLYSGFLSFPPILETIGDVKYALGFFYLPLVMSVLAIVSLVIKLRSGSKKIAQVCAQFGLFLSFCLTVWWLSFERGFFPTILLPAFFLIVVINDYKERARTEKGKVN